MTSDTDKTSETGTSRPHKRATVIEGEAREIPAAPEQPEASSEAQPQPGTEANSTQTRAAPSALFDWRSIVPAILIAAISGVSAGLLGAWLFSSPPQQAADTSAIDKTIAQLSSRLSQQESKQTPAPDLSPLNERSAKLETAAGELRSEVAEMKKRIEAQENVPTAADISAVNRRLAQIEEKIAALATASKGESKNDAQAAEVIALGALRDAVASGAPFAGELNAARAILKERAVPLAPLDKYAQRGLPTVPALARQFEPIAAKLASAPKAEDGGVFTRLWNNAGKLVEVRPVGEPRGSDPGAVVARMESKLARGDLAGALEDSKALPEPVRAQAKDWFAAAELRRDADGIIKNLINAALAGLSMEQPKQ